MWARHSSLIVNLKWTCIPFREIGNSPSHFYGNLSRRWPVEPLCSQKALLYRADSGSAEQFTQVSVA